MTPPPLSRLVLIGDLHTEATRLRHVLDHAAATRPDAILSVGDIVDGPEDVGACIALLRARDVLGNHDRWLAEGHPLDAFTADDDARAWIAALPVTRHLDTVAGPLLITPEREVAVDYP